MVAAWQVAAYADLPGRSPWLDPRLLWSSLALTVLILVGALAIAWLVRWREQSAAEPLSANEQLAHFRELYQRGELSQEEFERIRASLGSQLRQELNVPPGPQAPAAPPGQPPDPGAPPS